MGQKSFSSEEMQRYFSDPEYRRKYMKKRKKRFDTKHIIIYCLLLLIIGAAIWYWRYIVSGLPTLEQLENPRPELATKIYSSDGVVLDLLAYKNRMRISIDSVPPGLIQALLATEDKDFYSHWGVNLPRFVRQMALNVLTFQQAGASTITQQLSRNLYKLQGKNESLFDKVTRKIREFITAVQIERNFTKKEILELYLNVSYFGYNAYGIEAAAQTYFRKSASNLTMPEYTLLIGMLKGPSYYNPINHPERAFKRRKVVLESMLRDGLITDEMAQKVEADSLDFRFNEAELRTGIAPHFVEMLRQTLSKKVEKYGFDIYRDGLQVYTTLDSRMQRYANQAIEEHLNGYQKLFDSTWN
ncbi:MAG: transglycosylase domain-containing protein, partial [Bacteroidetes bacterium]|nr:transglycosylase domain-containing protein [Bacteroidota bacterium]